ncbi:putative bifunctional diguanylate cyclase/phosphodiesterase [Pseudomonas benzenivorans]|uniref:EAL domain-containing protein n=1 Tax=Pseudomonas benzenivorans TaxID=556533 RepID=A0ABY5HF96_9PSED|nr:EAL domain-containing protein [Pseudomonas benzenivorans]UTW09666.1 EAL domain-containing protein [Pseudomonas benzenivorans]
MKLRTRLPLLVVPLITAPLLLVGLLAFVELKDSARSRADQQTQLLLERFDAQLQQQIRSATANVLLFSEDPLLQKYLLAGDATERYALLQRPLQRKLRGIQRVFPQYYEIRVLLPDGFEDLRVDDGALPNLTEEEGRTPLFLAIQRAPQDTLTQIAINPDNRQPALYATHAVRMIDPSLDSYNATPQLRGYLSLTVSLQALLGTLTPSPWPKGGIALSDARGRPLAASQELEDSGLLQPSTLAALTSASEGERQVRLADQAYQHQARRLTDDLWIHLLVPETVLLNESRKIGNLVLLICLGAIALSVPLLLLVLRGQFIRPLERLNNALATLGQQQQLVQVTVQSADEIGELSRSFNQMSLALYQSNERIRDLAFSDSLTGLPNRLMFIKTLRREIEQARQHQSRFALLFLDLDNFKHINDTLGHAAGDQLLIKVTEIFQANLRGYDYLSRPVGIEVSRDMARLGGDEFTLLLNHPEVDQLAGPVAERIINALAEPIDLDGSECYVGCSIGIAIYPEDGNSVEDMVKHADLAMYQAKTRGKSNYQFFSSAIAERSQERVLLDQRLRSAVESCNFHLHYQPIVDSRSLRIKSVEALIRWDDPELGRVPPDQFIPLAEENGLILQIGQWVLEQAAGQLAAWKQDQTADLRMAVNVSSVQLAQPGFARQVARLLRQYQLGADELYIELTETAVLQGREQALANLHELRDLGVKVALDDFGTGYSSLSYLQTLPIDILKIDRSFILNLQENNNGVILSAIITMAHSLGMQVVAEGVEDQAHLNFLTSEGCDLLQGYLFSRPRPADEIVGLLSQPLPEAC